jgi:nitric oxide reductase subunit C
MLKKTWVILFSSFCIYTVWVYTYCDGAQLTYPDATITKGWEIWQRKNCQSCHQLYGLGGYMGPDLTNTASDSNKGEKYMFTLIKYGTGRMPDFHLTDTEVENVVAFLSWVDKSGKSKVAEESVHWTGTYIIDK